MPIKVAALYDIHGNLPALEAVLTEVHDSHVDEIVIGGDVVPGPMPGECLDLLTSLEIPIHFIVGNGDREVLAHKSGSGSAAVPEKYREVMQWNAAQLDERNSQIIAAWPPGFRINIDGLSRVLFCHATPSNDTDIFTRLTPELRLAEIFKGVDADVVVCGHTHMQFDLNVGKTRVVNAGSVGMPFGNRGAYWLLLGPTVEFMRTAYDIEQAAERIRSTSYPQRDEFVTTLLLDPRSEAEILKSFSGGMKTAS